MDEQGLTVLVYTQYDAGIMRRIREEFPKVDLKVVTSDGSFLVALPESDILYLQKEIALEISEKIGAHIAGSERLRWLQWGYTGLDRLKPFESLWYRLAITTTKGIMAETIADYVLLAVQLLYREFPRIMKNQTDRVWERWLFPNPRGKTLGIIGLGAIGGEVARKAQFFGMKVIGLDAAPVSADHVSVLFTPAGLREFLAEADVVAICVPLTGETEGLMSEEALHWMKPGSTLINVARGRVVDEEALVRALKSGHLAGAALDVFTREPLDPGSPLWSLKNVIISPHLSGPFREYPEMALDLFCKNLTRFLAGKELINRVAV